MTTALLDSRNNGRPAGELFTVFVAGDPKAQPRPRAFARKAKDGAKWKARVYTPGTAEEWKSRIALELKGHIPPTPLTGPLGLEIVFYFSRPLHHYGTGRNASVIKDAHKSLWITTRPDLDNLEKAVMDCLTQIGVYRDDAQIAEKITLKQYLVTGTPGAMITLRTLN